MSSTACDCTHTLTSSVCTKQSCTTCKCKASLFKVQRSLHLLMCTTHIHTHTGVVHPHNAEHSLVQYAYMYMYVPQYCGCMPHSSIYTYIVPQYCSCMHSSRVILCSYPLLIAPESSLRACCSTAHLHGGTARLHPLPLHPFHPHSSLPSLPHTCTLSPAHQTVA